MVIRASKDIVKSLRGPSLTLLVQQPLLGLFLLGRAEHTGHILELCITNHVKLFGFILVGLSIIL